jgi:hypothetical protein
MKPNRIVATLLLLAASVPAYAEIDRLQTLSQTEFRALAEDLGSALSSAAAQPPARDPRVRHRRRGHRHQLQASSCSARHRRRRLPSTLVVPSVRASLGRRSASIMTAWQLGAKTGVTRGGGALSWAICPATKLCRARRARELRDVRRRPARLRRWPRASLSYGFGPLTPLPGPARTGRRAPMSTTGLQREALSQTKVFGGLAPGQRPEPGRRVRWTGTANSYGAKLGLRFCFALRAPHVQHMIAGARVGLPGRWCRARRAALPPPGGSRACCRDHDEGAVRHWSAM